MIRILERFDIFLLLKWSLYFIYIESISSLSVHIIFEFVFSLEIVFFFFLSYRENQENVKKIDIFIYSRSNESLFIWLVSPCLVSLS
jgi:hypothetical protein